jgi:hypothetical protein
LLATFFTLVYCLLSDPEDGGNMFLRNVGWFSTDCKTLYPRGHNFWQPPLWEHQILHNILPSVPTVRNSLIYLLTHGAERYHKIILVQNVS